MPEGRFALAPDKPEGPSFTGGAALRRVVEQKSFSTVNIQKVFYQIDFCKNKNIQKSMAASHNIDLVKASQTWARRLNRTAPLTKSALSALTTVDTVPPIPPPSTALGLISKRSIKLA